MVAQIQEIRPQPGRQEQFLSSEADLVFYGGAAGGGKTFGLILEAARWIDNPNYRCVVFRRTYPEITGPGGMWDESQKLYPLIGGVANQSRLRWTFPSQAEISYCHCQHDGSEINYKGFQIDLLGFDQVEDFTAKQFWYLLSRNRGSSGIRGYCRATANPQPGWLADLLAWWISPQSGYPVPERAGVIRWLCRHNDQIHWRDTKAELVSFMVDSLGIDPKDADPISVTFIPATIEDNPIGMANNPSYRAKLMSMRHVDRERLLKGNWLIGDREGTEWPAEYFLNIWTDHWPRAFEIGVVAADPARGKKGGDYSAAVFMGLCGGVLYVDTSIKLQPVPQFIESVAGLAFDHRPDFVGFEDAGFQEMLAPEFERWCSTNGAPPWPVTCIPTGGIQKEIRIRRLGGYLQQNRFRLRRGNPDNKILYQQLTEFPIGEHDDGPDAMEMAMRMLNMLAANANADRSRGDHAEQLVPA